MKRKFSLTTKYVVVVVALMLAANIALGIVLMHQSTSAMESLVRKNMLDISNTAAAFLDGDELGALTEDDVGGPAFNEILEKLTVFQENIDIEFIYAVRQVGENRFVFTVDPDPVEPADFGDEIILTDALIQAGKGIATVDVAPAEDQWGNFYTSYSPVFDSDGRVAGIVGVDFDAAWYDTEIRRHTASIGIISAISVLVGAGVVLTVANRMRRRFNELNSQLTALSADVEALTEEITSKPDYAESVTPAAEPAPDPAAVQGGEDEIEELGAKIQSMQTAMKRYLEYLQVQARTDGLTRIGNTAAYQELLRALEEKIEAGTARFYVVVFDVDDLKGINDKYGHACGDMIIKGAASVISDSFGPGRTFRIGGDEFIAVAEDTEEAELVRRIADMETRMAAFNRAEKPFPVPLSISAGWTDFRPGQDGSFQEVFARADDQMYRSKGSAHRRRDRGQAARQENAAPPEGPERTDP